MAVELPYCKVNETFTACNCDEPCVTFTMRSAGNEITVEGLIDSGCTMTHVNSSIAEELGIDVSICPTVPIIGIGGREEGHLSEVSFLFEKLGDWFTGPVLFVQDLPVTVLLGQNNFFEKFDIHFQKNRHRFLLERVA